MPSRKEPQGAIRAQLRSLSLLMLAGLCVSAWGQKVALQPTPRIRALLAAARAQPTRGAKLAAFSRALEEARRLSDRYGEAESAFYAGRIAVELYRWEQAISLFKHAEPLYTAVGALRDSGVVLHEIGLAHDSSGDRMQAVVFFEKALAMEQRAKDTLGRGASLLALGNVYDELGQRQKALESCKSALRIFQKVDPRREALALNSVGRIYEELGQRKAALDAYRKALPLYQRVRDSRGRAQTLTNIGLTIDNLGQPQKALDYYRQALPLWGEDLAGKAATQNNMGKALKELRRYSEALATYGRALEARRKAGDLGGEAVTLNNIGRVHVEQGRSREALEDYAKALPLERQVGHREAEAITLRNCAYAWARLGQAGLAIAVAKQSVNLFQGLRSDLGTLDSKLKRSYAAEVAPAYRFLADQLIRKGRLSEAEEVIGLLKDHEYFRFLRSARSQNVDLTARESEWKVQYEKLGDELAKNARDYEELVRKAREGPLTPQQTAQKTELSKRLAAARVAFASFLKTAGRAFASIGADDERLDDLRTSTEIAKIVQALPSRPVAIYTLATQDGVRTILTLPHLTALKEAKSSRLSFADLSRKIVMLRSALTDPGLDPRPFAGELYDILFRPIEKDLLDAKAGSLMWSLDGPLRYLPVGALYDRQTKQYLCQKYPSSLFTPAKLVDLLSMPGQEMAAVGFGVSLPQRVGTIEFEGLSDVKAELDALKRLQGAAIYLDQAFTEAALQKALERSPRTVHLATHFRLKPGDASGSFILLGGGKTLPISAFAGWMQNSLDGVDAFVLSACDTATPVGEETDGGELESFARAAQENGAAAVIATLWPVNDKSTSLFMAHFYELRKKNPEVSKLEALNRTQQWLMQATLADTGGIKPARRSAERATASKGLPVYVPDPAHPFAHPFYWAPFVLTGNTR